MKTSRVSLPSFASPGSDAVAEIFSDHLEAGGKALARFGYLTPELTMLATK